MRSLLRLPLLAALSACWPAAMNAGNPLINTVHSADPSAHVWPGDERLWIYASHDQPGTNTHDTMISYHVFSSADLVNWTDHGIAMHQNGAKWAAGNMWAIDCVKRGELYYLVYCAVAKDDGNFHTALAVSKLPQGPFRDIGRIKGTEGGQDPALFMDKDKQAYLYWGGGNKIFAAKLSEDLLSVVPGSKIELSQQLKWCYEGPWMHVYQGKYYLTYPGLFEKKWPEHMYYATADHPMGPFTFKGEYIPLFKDSAGTNHGSVIQYKGRWIAFHHAAGLSGGNGVCRNLMADWLDYDKDGSIKPIIPTEEGVAIGTPPGRSRVTMLLEPENGEDSLGELAGASVAKEKAGYTGEGYIAPFKGAFSGVSMMAQSAMDRKVRVIIRYAADADQRDKLLVNYTTYDDPQTPEPGRFDKYMHFPATGGVWAEKDAGIVDLRKGDNTVRIYGGTGGICIDHVRLVPVD